MLCIVHGSLAQGWQVDDPYAYNDETVVYATLKTNVPDDPMSDFVLAAFIDSDCRAQATMPQLGNDGSQFFVLRVRGDQTDDQGKTIRFKAYHKPMGLTYSLALTVTYTGQSVGTPSHPILFNLERQQGQPVALESFSLVSDPVVYGQPNRLTLQPVPSNASFDSYSLQLSVSGSISQWTAARLERVWSDAIEFDVTPYYPGSLALTVTVGGKPVDVTDRATGSRNTLLVGDQIDLHAGWQWRSNAYGFITASNINEVFSGSQLVEVRTQDGLLYNDPVWGYFGTLMDMGIAQNTCYKVKMQTDPQPVVLTDGYYVESHLVRLGAGWTWVAVPYYYDRPLADALSPAQNNLPEGMVVVSKEDGSAEFDGAQWKGDLTTLRKGQGLMVYNPLSESVFLTFASETSMPVNEASRTLNDSLAAPAARAASVLPWHYDASRFMNNTTVVAALPEVEGLSAEWTVGVFAGDECRGEGHYADGLFFITIHADRGERIALKLRHQPSGQTFDISETLTAGPLRLGSLSRPVVLHADVSMLGIRETHTVPSAPDAPAALDAPDALAAPSSYDLTGRRTARQHRGLLLQRKADGTVRKILVSQ